MVKILVLKFIGFYQKFISPNLSNNCRFYPSCSSYFYQSIEKYGLTKGVFSGLKRVLNCHPWCGGGIDLP